MTVLSERDRRLFDVAVSVARTSTHYQASVGAVIVDGKDIVAVGVNGRKSHPLQAKYNQIRFNDNTADHLLHGELDACIKSGAHKKSLGRYAAIYVARVTSQGLGMARPCSGCIKALKDFGIHEVYYTTGDGFAYERLVGFRLGE